MKKQADIKKRALALLKSAEEVILEGSSRAAGFEDAGDFKRALLADLEAYEPFHEAVHDFHAEHAATGAAAPRGSRNKLGKGAGIAKNAGRVQASRFDPSVNQKDRRRGRRKPGGKRVGQGHGARGKS